MLLYGSIGKSVAKLVLKENFFITFKKSVPVQWKLKRSYYDYPLHNLISKAGFNTLLFCVINRASGCAKLYNSCYIPPYEIIVEESMNNSKST